MSLRPRRLAIIVAGLALANTALAAATFTYDPPGALVAGSGSGRVDSTVYAPGIRFPIQEAPAFANSQVWGIGGSEGPKGDQGDPKNFVYPWHDNYCETRTYDMPLCPGGMGHQGQDIRAASAEKLKYWAVAAVDGTVTSIGNYSVYLTDATGTRYDYLHMGNLQVKVGDKVTRGERIGMVSNEFNGTPTTIHLHFNLHENVVGIGDVYVPPYLSLVAAYQTLLDGKERDAGPDAAPAIPPRKPAAGEPDAATNAVDEAPLDEGEGCSTTATAISRAWPLVAFAFGALMLRRRRARR